MRTKIFILLSVVIVAVLASASSGVYADTASAVDVRALLAKLPPAADADLIVDGEESIVSLKLKRSRRLASMADLNHARFSRPVVSGFPQATDPLDEIVGRLNLTYRNVEYRYSDDGTPIGIVEILPTGEEVTICKILTARVFDAETGKLLETTTHLIFAVEPGFEVKVAIYDKEPDWAQLLAATAIAEGVYYGVRDGGMIAKAENEYNADGRKTFGVLKIWKFDSVGKLISTEVVKERLTYDRNGNLVSERTLQEIDGKLAAVKWVSYIYDSNNVCRMKSANEIHYDTEDGSIRSSVMEVSVFDKLGRETGYSRTEYRKNRVAYTETRTIRYTGDEIEYLYENRRWLDENGVVTNEEWRTVKSVWEMPADGVLIKHVEESWSSQNAEYYNYSVDTRKFDVFGRLIYRRVMDGYDNRSSGQGYKQQTEERYMFSEDEGTYSLERTCEYCSYSNGKITYRMTNYFSEKYEGGKIMSRVRIYKNESMVNGRLTITYYDEDIKEYEYDDDGDIVKMRRRGYWYSTYIDPYRDYLTTFLYDVIDGVKKLLNRQVSGMTAWDPDFTNPISYREEDETFTYVVINGQVLLASRVLSYTEGYFNGGVETSTRNSLETESFAYDDEGRLIYRSLSHTRSGFSNGRMTWQSSNVSEESFTYDADGNLAAKSRIEYYNGEITFMESVSYTYYSDGKLQSSFRNTVQLWGGAPQYMEDEMIFYNAVGNIVLRQAQTSYGGMYLETREYAEDGTTLLRRDIVADNYWSRQYIWKYFNGDGLIDKPDMIDYYGYPYYELHERYRPDGKMVWRREVGSDDKKGYDIYMKWGDSFELEESWEYADNGNLIRYESTKKSSSYSWLWCWPYLPSPWKDPRICYPDRRAWYDKIEENIVRKYDPQSGKLLKEEYAIKSDRWGGWMWDAAMKPFGGMMPNASDDTKVLIEGVTNFFLNHDYYGHTEQKMVIDYTEDGIIKVEFTVEDGSGRTLSALFGTIEYDSKGDIETIEFIYTGDRQDEWQATLEGLYGIFGRKIFVKPIYYIVDATIDEARPRNSDMEGVLAVNEAKAKLRDEIPEGVTVYGELANAPKTLDGCKDQQ